ncbi:DPB3 [Sanghuangporus vaninii]
MEQNTASSENAPVKTITSQKQPVKPSGMVLREEGRSLLPISRVQRIIKADKDLPVVAKEAVFAISIATEEFIKRVTAASQRQAERENRMTVQRKDFATVASKADEFFFLEDVLMWLQEDKVQTIKKTSKKAKVTSGAGNLAGNFNSLASNDITDTRTR